jgi:hypothetical protein
MTTGQPGWSSKYFPPQLVKARAWASGPGADRGSRHRSR